MNSKAWGGRFEAQPEDWVDDFNASIEFDKNLINQDIQGSIAHATMLANQHIITQDEAQSIIQGLKNIQKDFNEGNIEFKASLEDIHLNIEHELIQRIGKLVVNCIQDVVEMIRLLQICIYIQRRSSKYYRINQIIST